MDLSDPRLPELLVTLIQRGIWATSSERLGDQRIPPAVVNLWDQQASGIFLQRDVTSVAEAAP